MHSAHAEAVAEWFRKEGSGEEVFEGREGCRGCCRVFLLLRGFEVVIWIAGRQGGGRERRKLRS